MSFDENDVPGLHRRTFLGLATAALAKVSLLGVGSGCSPNPLELETNPPPAAPPVPDDVFQLGVASGDPLHDRVILWTRLAPEPRNGGGMPDVNVPVIWEVFEDEGLTRPVRNGWVWAAPALAHSVHVDVDRLEPSRTYWYRFRIGDAQKSSVGRTRTFPRPDSSPERLRLASATCQKFRDGYFTAHDHIAAAELDAVVFLGDYIYESGGESSVPGREPVDVERVTTLSEFRDRYGGYKQDPSLRRAHEAHPWIVTWDDHEVSNNYAGLHWEEARRDDGDPHTIRAAAYQAWYEHMPVRLSLPEDPANLTIYRRFDFGDLARLFVVDGRQYRDPQPCNAEEGKPCQELRDSDRSMLGQAQFDWLVAGMRGSAARWNVIAQQVLFSSFTLRNNLAIPDSWDGYHRERQRLLDVMGESAVRNPMVLSGDVHAAFFNELHADAMDVESDLVGVEVLCTSITSSGDGDGMGKYLSVVEHAAPEVWYADALKRGFTICEWTRAGCDVTYYAVSTVREPKADLEIAARFRVKAGTLEIERL